jgi:hypothetical protein
LENNLYEKIKPDDIIRIIISSVLHYFFYSSAVNFIFQILKIIFVSVFNQQEPVINFPGIFNNNQISIYQFQIFDLFLNTAGLLVFIMILMYLYYNINNIYISYIDPYILNKSISFILLFIFLPILYISNYASYTIFIMIISRSGSGTLYSYSYLSQFIYGIFTLLRFISIIIFTCYVLSTKGK